MQLAFLIINVIAFKQFQCGPKVQSVNHTGKMLEGFSKIFHSFSLCFHLLCSRTVTLSFSPLLSQFTSVTIACQWVKTVVNRCCLLTFTRLTIVDKHSWILGFLGHWPSGQPCATQHRHPSLQNSFSKDTSQENACRDRRCSATSPQVGVLRDIFLGRLCSR